MHRRLSTAVFFMVSLYATTAWSKAPAECPPAEGAGLQVLGSGGPIADDARASAGYVVWLDGKSRVLVDAGGGTFLRFAEAQARFADLDFVGLSHFHADHSVDFAALLKSGNFSGRERSLRVAGPSGAGPFPGLQTYLASQLSADGGAYGYLSGYLDGSRGLAELDAIEVGTGNDEPTVVYKDDDIVIDAMHVPHAIVPALGFRIRTGDMMIVFAGDQNGSEEKFVEFARDADMLVMHMPVPEGATGRVLQLHARPSRIAEIADAAKARSLVLSHFMARSLGNLDANVDIVRQGFAGTVVVAGDLMCVQMRPL